MDLFGLIVSDIRNPFFPDIAAAFQSDAFERGLDAIVMNSGHDAKRGLAAVQRLLALNVSGIAIVTSQLDGAVMDLLVKCSVPAVYLDLGTPGPFASNIAIDYKSAIGETLEHLLSLGHTRIAYISGPEAWRSARSRREAFEAVVSGRAETMIAEAGGSGVKDGYVTCGRMLASFRPTAIACFNDQLALGALHAAHDRGLRLPRDLSVTGFDDIAFAENSYPPLTTAAVPREELGRTALRALLELTADAAAGGSEYKLVPKLIVRSSTAPPRGGKTR
jgi:LacI family transcriptional regulator